jgi:hypothetical protein
VLLAKYGSGNSIVTYDMKCSQTAALYSNIKSKAGLAFAKAAAMCVTMHIDKSSVVVMGRPARSSQQHAPRLLSSETVGAQKGLLTTE